MQKTSLCVPDTLADELEDLRVEMSKRLEYAPDGELNTSDCYRRALAAGVMAIRDDMRATDANGGDDE